MSFVDEMAKGRLPPFPKTLGIETVISDPGHAELHLKLRPELLNGGGTAHGGVIAALIDTAVGHATSLMGGEGRQGSITLSLTVNYIAAVRLGGELRAVARVRGGGRSSAFCDCEVTDGDGTLVATGLSVMRQRPPKSPGQPAVIEGDG
jgi:uncharacterized protein (TIGR00369 family)